jgi:hypothetical protein
LVFQELGIGPPLGNIRLVVLVADTILAQSKFGKWSFVRAMGEVNIDVLTKIRSFFVDEGTWVLIRDNYVIHWTIVSTVDTNLQTVILYSRKVRAQPRIFITSPVFVHVADSFPKSYMLVGD